MDPRNSEKPPAEVLFQKAFVTIVALPFMSRTAARLQSRKYYTDVKRQTIG